MSSNNNHNNINPSNHELGISNSDIQEFVDVELCGKDSCNHIHTNNEIANAIHVNSNDISSNDAAASFVGNIGRNSYEASFSLNNLSHEASGIIKTIFNNLDIARHFKYKNSQTRLALELGKQLIIGAKIHLIEKGTQHSLTMSDKTNTIKSMIQSKDNHQTKALLLFAIGGAHILNGESAIRGYQVLANQILALSPAGFGNWKDNLLALATTMDNTPRIECFDFLLEVLDAVLKHIEMKIKQVTHTSRPRGLFRGRKRRLREKLEYIESQQLFHTTAQKLFKQYLTAEKRDPAISNKFITILLNYF